MPPLAAPLWDEFLTGDEWAFERIFLAHCDELYRYGRRLTRDEELVKNCIQLAAWLRFWGLMPWRAASVCRRS